MLENGLVDCAGTSGTSCEFVVVSALRSGSSIKLRNVAQPRFHLAVINGFLVGHVSSVCGLASYPGLCIIFKLACSVERHVKAWI